MYLPECLCWALENEDVSNVTIFCEDEIKEEVKSFFENSFADEWKNACEKAEKEFNGIEEIEFEPIIVKTCAEGVGVNVIGLEIRFAGGDFYDIQFGSAALENALKLTKEKFPNIEYEGYLMFVLSDRRCGEAYQWELSTTGKGKNKYDFIGLSLGRILSEEEHVWERAEEHEADELKFAVTGKLKHFENREEISEYIEDLGASLTGSISKNTSYLICNDVHSKSSKNEKAKELNVPVITETEFIARFGEPDEYDIDVYECSHFWYELGEQMAQSSAEECDYEEVIDVLYAYAEWIDSDDLRRAAYSLADMAAETEPEYRETVMQHIAELEGQV